jgi:hypothetical protein
LHGAHAERWGDDRPSAREGGGTDGSHDWPRGNPVQAGSGDGFFLVETLSEEQYRHTHLPGAVNLPPDAVRESAPELLPNEDADIVVYCAKPG